MITKTQNLHRVSLILKITRTSPEKLADEIINLKTAARKLAIEADEYQCGVGDGMNLADAITKVERLTNDN